MRIVPRSVAPRHPAARRRIGRLAAGIAVVAAAALVGAAPAHAASSNGCTVTPLKPTISPFLNASGQKVAVYSLKIACASPRRIEVTNQNAYEQDNGKVGDAGGDDALGAWHWVWVWNADNWTKTFSPTLPVRDWDTDATVELFHNARFRVCTTDAGICGPWVQTGNSPVLTGVTP
jgi:hypothetical protein